MAGVTKKVIWVAGKVKLSGTNILKVELASYNGNAGVDVRSWYTKDAEKVTEADKASMDPQGFLPGKGFFCPLTHVEWLSKKLAAVLTNEDFQKLLVEVKTSKTEDKPKADAAAEKLASENAALQKQMAEMQKQMAALLAAQTKGKGEAAAAKDTTGAAEELEDIALPESSVTRGKGKRSGK